jgi:hypothetical protein
VEKSTDKVSYKLKLIRVQRRKYQNCKGIPHSVERSPLHADRIDPIAIKILEAIKFHELTRGSTKEEALVDCDMGVKYWHHPAETILYLTEYNSETSTIQIFTDGSKSKQGVGAGIAIFRSGNYIKSLKYKLNKRWTNNQAEQLAILRAMEHTENKQKTRRPPYTQIAE